jgi:hypothetical protein
MTKRRDLLAPIRRWLKDPKHWTKGYDAVNARGNPCSYEKAVACCLVGTVRKYYPLGSGLLRSFVLQHVCDRLPKRAQRSVVEWNDAEERTHADVMALLKKPLYVED